MHCCRRYVTKETIIGGSLIIVPVDSISADETGDRVTANANHTVEAAKSGTDGTKEFSVLGLLDGLNGLACR